MRLILLVLSAVVIQLSTAEPVTATPKEIEAVIEEAKIRFSPASHLHSQADPGACTRPATPRLWEWCRTLGRQGGQARATSGALPTGY